MTLFLKNYLFINPVIDAIIVVDTAVIHLDSNSFCVLLTRMSSCNLLLRLLFSYPPNIWGITKFNSQKKKKNFGSLQNCIKRLLSNVL